MEQLYKYNYILLFGLKYEIDKILDSECVIVHFKRPTE